jgi:hypothetical protein
MTCMGIVNGFSWCDIVALALSVVRKAVERNGYQDLLDSQMKRVEEEQSILKDIYLEYCSCLTPAARDRVGSAISRCVSLYAQRRLLIISSL